MITPMKKNKDSVMGFTIMELMVVVIIIGVIAAFAIPNFQGRMERNIERRAIVNLLAMSGAVRIYLVKNRVAAIGTWNNIGEINTALGLNITDTGMDYSCLPNDGTDDNICQAQRAGGGPAWRIHFHDGGEHIHCWGGGPSCPSCQGSGGGGCRY